MYCTSKYLLIFIICFFNLKQISAQKPILPDFHADPSAHFWDGKYWIYPSTYEKGSTDWTQMKRWHTYSSIDLVSWKNEGEIFNLERVYWVKNSAFAPDAMKWKGKYYFFFPAEFKIGVAISNTPYGPFKDALGKPLIKKEAVKDVSSFDLHIFIDNDKTPYLLYGGGNGVVVAKLKDNLTEIDGEIKKLS
jgi:beta-xylosidase